MKHTETVEFNSDLTELLQDHPLTVRDGVHIMLQTALQLNVNGDTGKISAIIEQDGLKYNVEVKIKTKQIL